MAGHSRDADADVIWAGREPAAHHAWPGRLARLLAIAEAAALITVALGNRAEAGRHASAVVRPPGSARQLCPR